MLYAQAPRYQAVLLGQAFRAEDLGTFVPLEESAAEGALVLVRLDLAEPVTPATLAQLNQACFSKGVPPWPGYTAVAYPDPSGYSLYFAWQKGQVQWAIILAIVGAAILPAVLGGVIWALIPQSVKDLISSLVDMGIMVLIMYVMMQVMKPLSAAVAPKQVKAAPAPVQEAKA